MEKEDFQLAVVALFSILAIFLITVFVVRYQLF